jgi:hypothetical protein
LNRKLKKKQLNENRDLAKKTDNKQNHNKSNESSHKSSKNKDNSMHRKSLKRESLKSSKKGSRLDQYRIEEPDAEDNPSRVKISNFTNNFVNEKDKHKNVQKEKRNSNKNKQASLDNLAGVDLPRKNSHQIQGNGDNSRFPMLVDETEDNNHNSFKPNINYQADGGNMQNNNEDLPILSSHHDDSDEEESKSSKISSSKDYEESSIQIAHGATEVKVSEAR